MLPRKFDHVRLAKSFLCRHVLLLSFRQSTHTLFQLTCKAKNPPTRAGFPGMRRVIAELVAQLAMQAFHFLDKHVPEMRRDPPIDFRPVTKANQFRKQIDVFFWLRCARSTIPFPATPAMLTHVNIASHITTFNVMRLARKNCGDFRFFLASL